jgi:hypothetical protein
MNADIYQIHLPEIGCLSLRHREIKAIDKRDMPSLPSGFRASKLSLRLGAKRVYRDNRRKNSIQLRDYGPYWTIQLDSYNPETGFKELILHGLSDTPLVPILAAVGIVGLALKYR